MGRGADLSRVSPKDAGVVIGLANPAIAHLARQLRLGFLKTRDGAVCDFNDCAASWPVFIEAGRLEGVAAGRGLDKVLVHSRPTKLERNEAGILE